MRKAIFLSTLALLMTAAAVSLSAGTNGEHKDKWAHMKAELNLTDAQVSELQQKFEAIRPQGEDLERRSKALHSEIESLEKASSPDQQAIQEKRSQLEAMTREWHEKATAIFRSVLTPEQFTKLDQMHSKREQEEREEHEKQVKEHRDKMI
jgi:Spy/CpxP family protein refolding chaperone